MLKFKLCSIAAGGVLAFGMGSVSAAPLKIMLINQSGPGAFLHTTGTNWLTRYLTTRLGPQEGWTVVSTGNAATGVLPATFQSKFNDDSLSTFNVIIFNNSNSIGNVINEESWRLAFAKWVRKGGGVVGWHDFADHADIWPFVTDSLFGGSKVTEHSSYGQNLTTTKVLWDTLKTGDTVRSRLPEYAALKAGFDSGLARQGATDGRLTYPDEWWSFRSNPRLATPSATWGGFSRAADVLITIDEATYSVPSTARMGVDHPVAWAYKLPKMCPDTCRQGRFIYNARGHDTGAFAGRGAVAAPFGSDSAQSGPTKTFIKESILWAAAGQLVTSVKTSVGSKGVNILDAKGKNGILRVEVNGGGRYEITVYNTRGKKVAGRIGRGFAEHTFTGLSRGNIYLVSVRSAGKASTQRVML
jgi:hypothetical protein